MKYDGLKTEQKSLYKYVIVYVYISLCTVTVIEHFRLINSDWPMDLTVYSLLTQAMREKGSEEKWEGNSSNFALHYNYVLQSFFQNIALKGFFTQRWMAIAVSISQKNFPTKCRP
jgi:hypothetical protein